MRAGVAGLGMAAAVAERVELLDIAEPQAGLRLDPGAQADLEGAVARRIERAERQAGAPVAAARDQDQRLIALDRDDRGGQADLDRRQQLSLIRRRSLTSFEIEPERAALDSMRARADLLDRAHHAAVAPERAVGEADERGSASRSARPRGSPARSRSRRGPD